MVVGLKSDADLREPWESPEDLPKGSPFWRDRSFQESLRDCALFREASGYFGEHAATPVFGGQERIDCLRSSYKDHCYGRLLYAIVRGLRPTRCVELGVLQGYSLLTAASALRVNGGGTIAGFDLFEGYVYRHVGYDEVLSRIESLGLAPWATATRCDAWSVGERFESVDYLHVDLSNDGDTYRRVFRQWAHKVTKVMLLEGGAPERDRVEWMTKYGKAPIGPALDEIRASYPEWRIHVLRPFPSLTVALRVGALP